MDYVLDYFSTLEDPRQSWKVVYPLQEILLVVLCGMIAGADNFVEIERWARRKEGFLRRFLPFKHGICSHDTLNDVMNALPCGLFSECFVNWVSSMREDDPDIISIDGKTSRRAHASDGRSLHLVSAWASRQRLVLGQEACCEKENEISARAILVLMNSSRRECLNLSRGSNRCLVFTETRNGLYRAYWNVLSCLEHWLLLTPWDVSMVLGMLFFLQVLITFWH